MNEYIRWFTQAVKTSIQLYFRQECEYSSPEEVKRPANGWLEEVTSVSDITFDEQMAIMLALMPHICPQTLDIFFVQNKKSGRQYTEFGGWKGLSHGGFLPTGETLSFIIAGDDTEKRKSIVRMFQKDHWFYTHHILCLEGAGEGEPFLSGQLRVSEPFLSHILSGKEYKPDYNIGFPAKRIITDLDWKDLILDYQVTTELEEISTWIASVKTIMKKWELARFLKAGYCSLFYGPPGTGKTLAAMLLGKRNGLDVYHVGLSAILSMNISETEKSLTRLFDLAEKHNCILFFNGADVLFDKHTSNDHHVDRKVAYLLQRIEDFRGIAILAADLYSKIDKASSHLFQSAVYFPMPTKELRAEIWRKMLPEKWQGEDADELIAIAAERELSGGSITNVIRRCAIYMIRLDAGKLDKMILNEALRKEC